MESFVSDKTMMITRRTVMNTNNIMIGDRIPVGKYTATCQKVTQDGALFLMDQYLDQDYQMNKEGTNEGGYEASDLRKALQGEDVLAIFADYRGRMRPFEDGDLLRIPFHGEIFGNENARFFELDSYEQWPLMRDMKNRIAFRKNEWEWGWLQNKYKGSATDFCRADDSGKAYSWRASGPIGVRPVFLIV